ncbi:antifreeze protein Maxi-like [Cyclospora cayetanensis]|uniref:Antifreeze protein Maxi-like n=1 Tax=Cyclospora cayetanensis TaxID=88456 RepID=A0A6P6RZG0_9EIME|nr:antifreeze protein Maxi-like [Cyclospora cayetanensis]
METQFPSIGRRLPVAARPVKIAVTVADSKDLLPKAPPVVRKWAVPSPGSSTVCRPSLAVAASFPPVSTAAHLPQSLKDGNAASSSAAAAPTVTMTTAAPSGSRSAETSPGAAAGGAAAAAAAAVPLTTSSTVSLTVLAPSGAPSGVKGISPVASVASASGVTATSGCEAFFAYPSVLLCLSPCTTPCVSKANVGDDSRSSREFSFLGFSARGISVSLYVDSEEQQKRYAAQARAALGKLKLPKEGRGAVQFAPHLEYTVACSRTACMRKTASFAGCSSS